MCKYHNDFLWARTDLLNVGITKGTLVYLIAEQEVISEQGGISCTKVKRAGSICRAGWKFTLKKLSEQDMIREQG